MSVLPFLLLCMADDRGSGATIIVAIVAVLAIAVIAFLVLNYTSGNNDGLNIGIDGGGTAGEPDIVPDGE